jgi:hypothetical protein
MPFTDKSPAAWLGAGYNASTGKIELNTNTAATNKLLTELTDAEADETTGDIRKLLFGILDGLYTQFNSKNSALAAADRPQRITFTRSTSVNDATGFINRAYVVNIQLEAASVEVANEPA